MNLKGIIRTQKTRARKLLNAPFIKLEAAPREWQSKLDYPFDEDKTEYYIPIHRHFLNHFTNRLKSPLLDIGCGKYYLYFKDFFLKNHIEYSGISPDISDIPNCRIGRGEYLPYDDEKFNSVLILTSLDHVLDAARTLKECRRVLTDRGTLFIMQTIFPEKNTRLHISPEYREAHMRIYTLKTLKKAIECARFKILDVEKGYFSNQIYLTAEK